jgi:hypothetical protein
VGTPHVESLTGYFARLAEAHSNTPSVLLSQELAQCINKQYLFRGGARYGTRGSALTKSFRSHVRAINGVGTIAVDWSNGLEALTLRSNLRFLTMLTWNNVGLHPVNETGS